MPQLSKYWRDRAFKIHSVIKERGIAISRDYPAEMLGAFLTYFTRQELLVSEHGDGLMNLLQDEFSPKPYVILDEALGTKRIATLLNLTTAAAAPLAPLFMEAFEAFAPGHVFRDEDRFVTELVLPRVKQALQTSSDFAAAFSAMESDRFVLKADRYEDSDYLYHDLPTGVPTDRPAVDVLRSLREDKGDTWLFRGVFDVHPADAAGNIVHKYIGWCDVSIHFRKLDRAIIAAGQYSAEIYGSVARAWSGGGPFDQVSSPNFDMTIAF